MAPGAGVARGVLGVVIGGLGVVGVLRVLKSQ